MSTPFSPLGLPENAAAWVLVVSALALAILWTKLSKVTAFLAARPRLSVTVLSVTAGILSLLYVAHYLRGGPRIVDATSYFLEARTFASGHFSLNLPEPSGSFRGRFLLPGLDGKTQAVIFPPGYPAVLAVGFLAHAPMFVGPILACGLVLATYLLSREIFADSNVALTAALLSVLCAALRYHTADTMSHGLSALLFTLSLLGSFKGKQIGACISGLALGWLLATRPVTGLVGVLICTPWLIRNRAWLALPALLPGLTLLSAYQASATGSAFNSPQLAYYALSDGPENCFRLGFGQGIGCRFEHGEFVQRELRNGYGLLQAGFVTARRLGWHLGDITNFVPAALLLPWAGKATFANPQARTLLAAVILQMCAYALFYYDGNYPGGGARLFADILPLEHILLAYAFTTLGLTRWLAPTAFLGFALHVGHGHAALREREGGRPMYEPEVLRQAKVTNGLVFVRTDHGFNLGHDPGLHSATSGVFVARRTDDDREYALFESLGRPPTYRYEFDAWHPNTTPVLRPFVPTRKSTQINTLTTFYELEREWPPLERSAGWAKPSFSGAPCVSGGRGLRLMPSSEGNAAVQVALPAHVRASVDAELTYWVKARGAAFRVHLASNAQRQLLVDRTVAEPGPCQSVRFSLDLARRPGSPGAPRLEIETTGGEVLFDSLRITEAHH
ncbi:MAG: hypothetical protein SFV15_21320 [Polyangiaceae bacterium]|nr:hypothetical protein [Polyangiaceae bacterium]